MLSSGQWWEEHTWKSRPSTVHRAMTGFQDSSSNCLFEDLMRNFLSCTNMACPRSRRWWLPTIRATAALRQREATISTSMPSHKPYSSMNSTSRNFGHSGTSALVNTLTTPSESDKYFTWSRWKEGMRIRMLVTSLSDSQGHPIENRPRESMDLSKNHRRWEANVGTFFDADGMHHYISPTINEKTSSSGVRIESRNIWASMWSQ